MACEGALAQHEAFCAVAATNGEMAQRVGQEQSLSHAARRELAERSGANYPSVLACLVALEVAHVSSIEGGQPHSGRCTSTAASSSTPCPSCGICLSSIHSHSLSSSNSIRSSSRLSRGASGARAGALAGEPSGPPGASTSQGEQQGTVSNSSSSKGDTSGKAGKVRPGGVLHGVCWGGRVRGCSCRLVPEAKRRWVPPFHPIRWPPPNTGLHPHTKHCPCRQLRLSCSVPVQAAPATSLCQSLTSLCCSRQPTQPVWPAMPKTCSANSQSSRPQRRGSPGLQQPSSQPPPSTCSTC